MGADRPKHAEPWDRTLPRSIVHESDLRAVAHGISGFLHHVTGIPPCENRQGSLCQLCGSAMRLVVQGYEPKLLEVVGRKITCAIGFRNADLKPIFRGDD